MDEITKTYRIKDRTHKIDEKDLHIPKVKYSKIMKLFQRL